MIVDVHLYKIFRIVDFIVTFKCGAKKAGESGHSVRTLSLRCYKILMQLFMLLHSGRNVVVHPYKTFPMCPLWSVEEDMEYMLWLYCTEHNFPLFLTKM